MSDILIRKAGRAGRITLNRPQALNALTWEMCLAIETALDDWRDDREVAVVVIDGAGDRAFCSGGDISEMYRTASHGDYDYGRRFWADEYRLNAKIAEYTKPYIAFLQGFTMGGGVGISCHGSHRIVGDTSRIAMPECGIGLIPDVGGTLLLARAPGHLGEYLGATGYRMDSGDAILTGFASHYLPEAEWQDLIARLEATGKVETLTETAHPAPEAKLAGTTREIDRHFGADTARAAAKALRSEGSEFSEATLSTLAGKSPLAVACTHSAIRVARKAGSIRAALEFEYRFTWRSAEHGDFVEGIRAAIIDRDGNPRWRHGAIDDVTDAEIAAMLAPVPEARIDFAAN